MSLKVQETGISLERIVALLSTLPNEMQQANRRAMKRAGEAARTQAARLASVEYHISQGQFRSNTTESFREQGVASITIRYAGSVIPLIQFHVRRTRGGIFAQAMRTSDGGVLRNSFIASLGEYPHVYTRLTPSRFPIKKLYGPSTGHMMQNEDVADEMGKVMKETYDRRLEHEMARILEGKA